MGTSSQIPLNCTHCKRVFSRPEHLNRHIRAHTGERPYRCSVCKRNYARRDVLLRHQRAFHSLEDEKRPGNHQDPSPALQSTPHDSGDASRSPSTDPNLHVFRSSNALAHSNSTPSHALGAGAVAERVWHTTSLDFDLESPFDLGLDLPSIQDAIQAWTSSANTDVDAHYSIAASGLFAETPETSADDQLPSDRARQVQRAWPRKNAAKVVRMIHRLWERAVDHPVPNLFSSPILGIPNPQPTSVQPTTPRWNMDEECRLRLIKDCRAIFLPAERHSGGVTAPGSPRITMTPSETVEVDGLSPHAERTTFPTLETLETSIDFFFRRCHPVTPFLHKATFDAKRTPSPLLLSICLIGLNGLKPKGGRRFVLEHVGGLMRYCRLDLTYKALGKTGAHSLLTSLASALLVLYLCLGLGNLIDIHQAHMLAIQTLFIADRHGLFLASQAGPLNEAIIGYHTSTTSYWETWARVESLKRLILCLMMIDCSYTRTLDLAAIMTLDRVEVIAPCSSTLFDSPDGATFYHTLRSQQAFMPLADLSCSTNLSSIDDEFWLRCQLAFLSLSEAACRHRLLPTLTEASTATLAPSTIYHTDSKANLVVQKLLLLTQACADHFARPQPVLELTWNHICLSIVADLNLIHVACGKEGLSSSRRAIHNLRTWANSAHGRRALLHASQIYSISSRYRLGDDKTLCHESILSSAAMTHAIFYLLHTSMDRTSSSSRAPPIDLADDIAWSSVGDVGVWPSPTPEYTQMTSSSNASVTAARTFILEGGAFSMEGQISGISVSAARQVLLQYAQLLDEIDLADTAEHSDLLRTVADFVGVLEVPDAGG